MSKLTYSVTYQVEKDFLIDEETLRHDFGGSWQRWLDFFAKEELGEVITGIGTDPVAITVLTEATAKQQIEDFYRNKIPKKVNAEMPNATTVAYNRAIDDITAQFNRGDNDE